MWRRMPERARSSSISNGLAGVLFEGPVTVQVTPFTRFLGGLTGINDLTGTTALNLRVVGLIPEDQHGRSDLPGAQR